MAEVIPLFPGAGTTPAPAGPPRLPADLDGIGERYTAYVEARDSGAWTVNLYARLCADDIPALRDEIHHLEALRRELADELDRIRGGA
ncbi:hypothetical protein GA0074692_0035 [Micromonospora pallida]|uniref:Uncharacterized protein n=1 Tax=Micromonospora pallida TaxID=145854 RepID=A0A1C6RH23_9ACTN|nr:hypothetical protein [Micromonospora pallida]SCL16460.1 hypothetical protein GA0074692_0035 [Micromonospora pallida]